MKNRLILSVAGLLLYGGCGQTLLSESSTAAPGDVDGDTFSVEDGDCDDANASINPDAEELCDGIDGNCDGVMDDEEDKDGDGVSGCETDGSESDCDDTSPILFPGNAEVPYDGLDQDCDGLDLIDADGDGWSATEVGGKDCDDTDPTIYPDAEEVAYDQIDQDCDAEDLTDVDGDGIVGASVGGDDCDDLNAEVHPDAIEVIDGMDNNCDGIVDLVGIEGAQGMFIGEYTGDQAGMFISEVGDVNGDGISDFGVGAPGADGLGPNSGKAYVIFGTEDGSQLDGFDLSYADLTFVGSEDSEEAGTSINAAGDLNGDLIDDLVIVGPGANEGELKTVGRAYIYFGRLDWASRLNLADADGIISGEFEGDGDSMSAIGPGDFNGDGFDDLAVSTPFFDDPGYSSLGLVPDRGAVGIFYGGDSLAWDLLMSEADQLWIGEAEGDEVGSRMVSIGDLTNDGRAELVLSAPGNDEAGDEAGKVYMLLGQDTYENEVAFLSNADVELLGETGGDRAGGALASGRDINGDGYNDLIVGAPGAEASAGASYVILGKPSGLAVAVSLEFADAKWVGTEVGGQSGAAVAMVSKPGGDGAALWIGSPSSGGGIGNGQIAFIDSHNVLTGGTLDEATAVMSGEIDRQLGKALCPSAFISSSSGEAVLAGVPGDASGGLSAGAVVVIAFP